MWRPWKKVFLRRGRRKRRRRFLGGEGGAEGYVAGGEAFGKAEEIRRDGFMLAGEHFSGAAEGGHYFVEDEEEVVLVGEVAEGGGVPGGWRRMPPGMRRAGSMMRGGVLVGVLVEELVEVFEKGSRPDLSGGGMKVDVEGEAFEGGVEHGDSAEADGMRCLRGRRFGRR